MPPIIGESPRFPVEIWQNILRFATFVPNLFDTHAPDLFAYPGPPTRDEVHELLRQSLPTKFSVVLVCKAWNELATRFLYEAVFLSPFSSFHSVLRGLKDDVFGRTSQIPDYRRSKGRWTKRLDTQLPGCDRHYLGGFSTILKRLPNLEIIVAPRKIHNIPECHEELLQMLVSQALRNLRVLDIPECDWDFASPLVPNRFHEFPLRVLRIGLFWGHVHDGRPGGRVLGPHLEYLHLEGPAELGSIIDQGPFPLSLTYLSFELEFIVANEIIAGCLTGVGHHLTTLELEDSRALRHPDEPFFDGELFELCLRKIAESCPNLRNLILNIRCPGNLIRADYLPPVEKLGLRPFMRRSAGLHKMVTKFVSVTPSIKVVRILGKPTYDELAARNTRTFDTFRRTSAALMAEYGVRYEDRYGKIYHGSET